MFPERAFRTLRPPMTKDMDDISIQRDFEYEVERPLKEINGAVVTTLRRLRYGSHNYPLLLVQYPAVFDADNPTVLLTAGMHAGNEPAGVYAVMKFLEKETEHFADRLNMCFLPCMNPSGFEAGTRLTMNGVDLNREFGKASRQPEIRALEEWLKYFPRQFRLVMDLHENDPDEPVDHKGPAEENPKAVYLYEWTRDDKQRIGRQLIDTILRIAPVCLLPTIEKDVNDRGVIAYPEARLNECFDNSFDAYVMQHCTDHFISPETPTVWPLSKRIAVHKMFLRTALAQCLESPVE